MAKVFIGSSREAGFLLRTIATWVEKAGHEAVPWDSPGLFSPGSYLLPELINIAQGVSAAVFIFTADDQVWYRRELVNQPRDNVVLEYGLFAGILGPERVAVCVAGPSRTATDLSGMIYIDVSDEHQNEAQLRFLRWLERIVDRPELATPPADTSRHTGPQGRLRTWRPGWRWPGDTDPIEWPRSPDNTPRPSLAGRRTRIVDCWGGGDYVSIAHAINDSRPGDRILVRPGSYQDPIVLDKALLIIGDGPREDVIVEVGDTSAIVIKADGGLITGLTVRQSGGTKWHAIDVEGGKPTIEDCELTCASRAVLRVGAGAEAVIRRNHIHHGADRGLVVCDGASGIIEDNVIEHNLHVGVDITRGAVPIFRRNTVRANRREGIWVRDGADAILEDNFFVHNGLCGIEVTTHANPRIVRNLVQDNKLHGIWVHELGRGHFMENKVLRNWHSGVEVSTGGRASMVSNTINENLLAGVSVHDDGGGHFENNELLRNRKGQWDIASEDEAAVDRRGNHE